MFSAIGRLFKAIFYAITFQFDKLTATLRTKESVIRATYDGIANAQTARIQQTKTAVAGLMRFKATKEIRMKTVSEDIDRLQKLIAGAAAKAKQRVAQLQAGGMTTIEQFRTDAEYVRCQKAFTDFQGTLTDRRKEAESLEHELSTMDSSIGENKNMLEGMLRELDKIKQEGEETVADAAIAKQKKEISDLMTGISVDTTSKERQSMQEMRQKLKAEADISQQLAGIDHNKAEADFMQYAAASEANTEFEQLLGLATATAPVAVEAAPATAVPATRVDSKLPE